MGYDLLSLQDELEMGAKKPLGLIFSREELSQVAEAKNSTMDHGDFDRNKKNRKLVGLLK